MFNLITIGDSTIDTYLVIDEATLSCGISKEDCLLCLNYADKTPIVHSDQSVGGNAANVAVGVKRLGLSAAIVTELGDDINGKAIKHTLEASGIDTRFVRMIKNEATRYSVILNYRSERTILSYHADRDYLLPKLAKSEWIYYTSLGKTFENIQKKLLVHLKKNPQTKLAMNPGSYQLKHGLKQIRAILPFVNLLFVNKQEAEKIIGKKKTIKLICQAFHKHGVKNIVITDGIKGSFASDEKQTYFMPAYPIKAIAKTGAGDAYTGGFLSAIIYGKSLPIAMQWGTANASGVIQKVGAQHGLLTKPILQKMIKKYAKIKPMAI